ncbi:conserved hypothetical protein [Azospirillaceae bacterium]
MTHQEFDNIFDETVKKCQSILNVKKYEYATEDRLHNFKAAAYVQGITSAVALSGMMAKHIISLFDMLRQPEINWSLETWDEKIIDAINYLILLRALIKEEERIIG